MVSKWRTGRHNRPTLATRGLWSLLSLLLLLLLLLLALAAGTAAGHGHGQRRSLLDSDAAAELTALPADHRGYYLLGYAPPPHGDAPQEESDAAVESGGAAIVAANHRKENVAERGSQRPADSAESGRKLEHFEALDALLCTGRLHGDREAGGHLGDIESSSAFAFSGARASASGRGGPNYSRPRRRLALASHPLCLDATPFRPIPGVPGACRHSYRHAVIGAAVTLTKHQLLWLHGCAAHLFLFAEVDLPVSLDKPYASESTSLRSARPGPSGPGASRPGQQGAQPRATRRREDDRSRLLLGGGQLPDIDRLSGVSRKEAAGGRAASAASYSASSNLASGSGSSSDSRSAEAGTQLQQLLLLAAMANVSRAASAAGRLPGPAASNLTAALQSALVELGLLVHASASAGPAAVDSWPAGSGSNNVNAAAQNPFVAFATSAWHLDRIDQRDVPLDGMYRDDGAYGGPAAGRLVDTAGLRGRGVKVYVLDTGVRTTHQEFAATDTAPSAFAAAGGAPGPGRSASASASASGTRAFLEADFVGDGLAISGDCDGHGTHVAAIAVGAHSGVARSATIHAVRVLDCTANGNVSTVVAGLDFVQRAILKDPPGTGVLLMALGIPRGAWSFTLEAAVRSVAASTPVVVAAGNSKADACDTVPAGLPEVIAVAGSDLPVSQRTASAGAQMSAQLAQVVLALNVYATQAQAQASEVAAQSLSFTNGLMSNLMTAMNTMGARATAGPGPSLAMSGPSPAPARAVSGAAGPSGGASPDADASYSGPQSDFPYEWTNSGRCISLFAPGVDIRSACGGVNRCPVPSDTAYATLSGTSMASPQAAGLVALYLAGRHAGLPSNAPPSRPAEVKAALAAAASPGRIRMLDMREGTPNRLLYTAAQGPLAASGGPAAA